MPVVTKSLGKARWKQIQYGFAKAVKCPKLIPKELERVTIKNNQTSALKYGPKVLKQRVIIGELKTELNTKKFQLSKKVNYHRASNRLYW